MPFYFLLIYRKWLIFAIYAKSFWVFREKLHWFVLKVLYQCTEERKAIGREGILECAKKEKFFLSQIGVRTILGILKEYGLARVSRGRGGSRMTCLGREIWEHRE